VIKIKGLDADDLQIGRPSAQQPARSFDLSSSLFIDIVGIDADTQGVAL
jgi:hypothetical protein